MEKSSSSATLFIAGAFMGALTALLLAPKSGAENREMLQSSYDKAKRKVQDTKQKVANKAEKLADDAAAELS